MQPILLRLHEKATRTSLTSSDKDGLSCAVPTPLGTEEVDEALSMIGGTKNVVNEECRPQNGIDSGTLPSPSSDSPATRNSSDMSLHQTPVSHERTTKPSLMKATHDGPNPERNHQDTRSSSAYDASSYHIEGNDRGHQSDLPDQQFPSFSTGSGGPPEWGVPRSFQILPPQTLTETCPPEIVQDPSSIRRCELPYVSSSTDRLREYTHLEFGPAGFPMNVDVARNDFDVRGISNMTYFVDPTMNPRVPGDEDATIEDAWRNILEDARLSTSGLNSQFFY